MYKICDSGKCILCKHEHKELYNFCDNEHDDKGICLECFKKMKEHKCPICNENIIEYVNETLLCKIVK